MDDEEYDDDGYGDELHVQHDDNGMPLPTEGGEEDNKKKKKRKRKKKNKNKNKQPNDQ